MTSEDNKELKAVGYKQTLPQAMSDVLPRVVVEEPKDKAGDKPVINKGAMMYIRANGNDIEEGGMAYVINSKEGGQSVMGSLLREAVPVNVPINPREGFIQNERTEKPKVSFSIPIWGEPAKPTVTAGKVIGNHGDTELPISLMVHDFKNEQLRAMQKAGILTDTSTSPSDPAEVSSPTVQQDLPNTKQPTGAARGTSRK
jgi:hypothetical protein